MHFLDLSRANCSAPRFYRSPSRTRSVILDFLRFRKKGRQNLGWAPSRMTNGAEQDDFLCILTGAKKIYNLLMWIIAVSSRFWFNFAVRVRSHPERSEVLRESLASRVKPLLAEGSINDYSWPFEVKVTCFCKGELPPPRSSAPPCRREA